METIHTDSPYRAFSINSRKSNIEMPLDQTSRKRQRTLESSDVPQESVDSDITVRASFPCEQMIFTFFNSMLAIKYKKDFILQDNPVTCPFTHTWNSISWRMQTIKEMDYLINYGLALMFPIVAFSSWFSWWKVRSIEFWWDPSLAIDIFLSAPFSFCFVRACPIVNASPVAMWID